MKHLLSIDDVNRDEIKELIEKSLSPSRQNEKNDRAVVLVFEENSTRTRVSFERACQVLGRPYIVLDASSSSLSKGESWEDTLDFLEGQGVSQLVIRSAEKGRLESLRPLQSVRLINAGDGSGEHPTQALLDLCTIFEKKEQDWSQLEGLKLALVGDCERSRTAHSWAKLAPKMGFELHFFSPKEWGLCEWANGFPLFQELPEKFESYDVVMPLRVQKERVVSHYLEDWDAYKAKFCVQAKNLEENTLLMAPGPINWGIEMHASLRDDPRSLIHQQTVNGLKLRSCLLSQY